MMNSLAYSIVTFLCFCCSVNADSSNVTSLMANCSSTGGCDFEFIIDQYAVEITGMDELRSVVNNITETNVILKEAVTELGNAAQDAEFDANQIDSDGVQKDDRGLCHLGNINIGYDGAMEESQRAVQAIMDAALCFQSADPNKNCGAMIPSKLNPVYYRNFKDCPY
uniref:Uncharacterized protein n=1 Tax=Plectus sambesii TaxID=2011161 RepID=A0A914VFQ3_9BILA